MMSFTSAESSALMTSALSFAMTSFGVPAGTMMPNQLSAAKPVRPPSETVGRSGSTGERREEATAMPRSLPARTCGSEDGMLSKKSVTVPESRSVIAGALPLYGMWLALKPPIDFMSSYSRWESVPLPCEAKFTLPPCAFR